MISKLSTSDLLAQKLLPAEFSKLKRHPISLILNNIRSLQNVGLIFRIADSFLIEKVYLTGFTGYPPLAEDDPRSEGVKEHAQREISKTAINLIPFVKWEYQKDPVLVIKELKKKDYQIVALEQTWQSKKFIGANYRFPLALIVGHERDGVDELLLDLSDLIIEIPMLGMGNSHNVAISTALTLSEIIFHQNPSKT